MPLSGYSGTPLVKKLGIKPGTTLVLMGAPRGFKRQLVGLPRTVRIQSALRGSPDLTIWFVSSRRELQGRVAQVAASMGQGLWVAWPKKASGIVTDVTEDVIRDCALPHGIVDYKVCAINETWSGLKFARRKGSSPLSEPTSLIW